jgi:hypothetical protein
MNSLKVGIAGLWGKVFTVVLFHPAPLVLLATGVFYLWIYFRRTAQEKRGPVAAGESLGAAVAANHGASL